MKANDDGATLEKSRGCLLSDRAWLYYWRSIVWTRPRRNTYSLPKTVGNVQFFFLETSLKTHDKVGRTRSWSLLQISHKSHKHENEDKNEATNFSLPSSSLFLILGSKSLCCFVEVLYRAIINTFLFNGVKPSEIKVKRTNKRQRSKRICRFVRRQCQCLNSYAYWAVTKPRKLFCSYWTWRIFILIGLLHIYHLWHWHFFVLSAFLHYMEEYFTLGSRIVFVLTRISFYWGSLYRDFYIEFTVTLAGLKNIVRYTEESVIKRCVKSKFHCIFLFLSWRSFLCLFFYSWISTSLVRISMPIVTHS